MTDPAAAPRGQVLVIVALGIIVLLALAGVAIDVGRVMAERRHLQTAADAGALAACQSLKDGAVADPAVAEQRAREVAGLNIVGSPAGAAGSMADPPVYEDEDGSGFLDADELASGVVVSSNSARVAISSTVDTLLARVVGIPTLGVGARAHCTLIPEPALPMVARRYDQSPFTDVVSTAGTSHLGGIDSDPLGYDGVRTPASPTDPGPVFELYGNLSKAHNSSEFRGFVVLDIRDFTDETVRKYYNGAEAGMSEATLKDKESEYFITGYPGPEFPAATSPPTGDLQVATLPGHNSDQLVHQFDEVYDAGDRILLGVYDGTVKTIPDFSIDPPAEIVLPSTTTGPVDGPTFRVSGNTAFSTAGGIAHLELLGDTRASDPANNILPTPGNAAPAAGEMNEPVFSPDDFTPAIGAGTIVEMQDISTNAVAPGIYTVWVKGTSSTPNKARRHPVPVYVGGATRDFDLDNSTLSGSAANLGDTISFEIRVRNQSWGSGGSAVQLAWDSADLTDCVLNPVAVPAGMTVTFSPSSVTPASGQGALSTMTVNTSGLASGCYRFPLRVSGTNGASQPVTHLVNIKFYVAKQPDTGNYVDMIGFAMFEVDDVVGNTITAHAISRVCADPTCDDLRAVLRPRLIPWS